MPLKGNLTLNLKHLNYSINDDTNATNITNESSVEDNTNFGEHNITAIVVLTMIYGLLSLTACVGNLLVIWIIGKWFYLF